MLFNTNSPRKPLSNRHQDQAFLRQMTLCASHQFAPTNLHNHTFGQDDGRSRRKATAPSNAIEEFGNR